MKACSIPISCFFSKVLSIRSRKDKQLKHHFPSLSLFLSYFLRSLFLILFSLSFSFILLYRAIITKEFLMNWIWTSEQIARILFCLRSFVDFFEIFSCSSDSLEDMFGQLSTVNKKRNLCSRKDDMLNKYPTVIKITYLYGRQQFPHAEWFDKIAQVEREKKKFIMDRLEIISVCFFCVLRHNWVRLCFNSRFNLKKAISNVTKKDHIYIHQ